MWAQRKWAPSLTLSSLADRTRKRYVGRAVSLRKLGLSDLPDLLAPAYTLISNAGRQLITDPVSAIKTGKSRR